ncbi:acyltransferase [Actinomycetospora sp. CA-053990]|uniref:acyltransferase n=1 Tax=Actinomycetospora sp. CA-053990 TaxID=3239891 RepID=UPI003D943AFA
MRNARLRALAAGEISIGSDVAVGKRAQVSAPDFFSVRDRVRIGQDFLCEVNADISSDVLISSRVSFIGNDHSLEDVGTIFDSSRLPSATVRLLGDNLIGHGTVILGNVVIGRGAIVGAGSLVTGDLPDGWICYGRPAKPQKPRASSASANLGRGGAI